MVFSVPPRLGPLRAAAIALACAVPWMCACNKNSATNEEATPAASAGELRVIAGEHGFSPGELAIPKGAPGSLAAVTFMRTTDQTCATEVVFPELDVKKSLPLNSAVTVNVPSDAARTLTFQCGMGMYKGTVVVR